MDVFYERIKNIDFAIIPLLCLIDGAKSLINAFNDEFEGISNKVMILYFIRVIEYIWPIAHIKYKEGSNEAKAYGYEKLLMILKWNVCVYIKELEDGFHKNKIKTCQKKIYQKVISHFKNHQMYIHSELIFFKYLVKTIAVPNINLCFLKSRIKNF